MVVVIYGIFLSFLKKPLTLIRIGFHYYTDPFTILQVFYCLRHYPITRKHVRLPGGRPFFTEKTGPLSGKQHNRILAMDACAAGWHTKKRWLDTVPPSRYRRAG